jgi:formate--tetrahydrofolate ligase
MPTDIEIARQATLKPITAVAAQAGVPDEALIPYGKYKAKIDRDALPEGGKQGKLILVTAINPTPAGEGKTTTSVGLPRPLLRRQGRRRRRRQEPGHADGRDQPALHG